MTLLLGGKSRQHKLGKLKYTSFVPPILQNAAELRIRAKKIQPTGGAFGFG